MKNIIETRTNAQTKTFKNVLHTRTYAIILHNSTVQVLEIIIPVNVPRKFQNITCVYIYMIIIYIIT